MPDGQCAIFTGEEHGIGSVITLTLARASGATGILCRNPDNARCITIRMPDGVSANHIERVSLAV